MYPGNPSLFTQPLEDRPRSTAQTEYDIRTRCLSLDSPMERYASSSEKTHTHVCQAYIREKIRE